MFSPSMRSKIMSKIKSKNTKAEILLRKELWRMGIRGYRIHYNLPGRPDIVFTTVKLAVFIDGDFWHGYLWKKGGKIPEKPYWKGKITSNIARDKRVNIELRKRGWKVTRVWEHEVMKNPQMAALKIQKVYTSLKHVKKSIK